MRHLWKRVALNHRVYNQLRFLQTNGMKIRNSVFGRLLAHRHTQCEHIDIFVSIHRVIGCIAHTNRVHRIRAYLPRFALHSECCLVLLLHCFKCKSHLIELRTRNHTQVEYKPFFPASFFFCCCCTSYMQRTFIYAHK